MAQLAVPQQREHGEDLFQRVEVHLRTCFLPKSPGLSSLLQYYHL